MATTQWTKSKLERYVKEGRGQGVGVDYKPWKNTYEFSSKGRASRVYGLKTGRIHQLHSDNQYRAFLIFEYHSQVSDIRESYPLLDINEVIDKKDDLRFDKFTDKQSGEPYVLTTNFLLTIQQNDGSKKYLARTVKNTTELKRKVTIEKLEIERRYWLNKGTDWKIITEKQLPRQLAKNIEWVRETLLQTENAEQKSDLSFLMYRFLLENQEIPLKEALKLFEKTEGLNKGEGLYLFRFILAKKLIEVDMKKQINLSARLIDILI